MDIPLNPPASWFEPPRSIPTERRITIEEDGRVYGYVALWETCHSTLGNCVRPPKGSPSNYELSHTGETRTAEGALVATANIGGGAGHIAADASPEAAARFYADTSTQLMRVKYGEDSTGLWFAGALWPDVSELDVARIQASAISGDWRPVALWRRGQTAHDFVGSCFVNVPGYAMRHKGQITTEAGQPQMIAAAAGAAPGDIVVVDERYVLSMDENEKTCDGSCDSCTCGAKPVTAAVVEGDTEMPRGPAVEAIEGLSMKVDELRSMMVSMSELMMAKEVDSLVSELES